jgi:hypothetical protein
LAYEAASDEQKTTALLSKGIACMKMEEYNEAIQAFREISESKPEECYNSTFHTF